MEKKADTNYSIDRVIIILNVKEYEKIFQNKISMIFEDSLYELGNLRRKAKGHYARNLLWYRVSETVPSSDTFFHGMIFSGNKGCGRHTAASVSVDKYIESFEENDYVFLYLSTDIFNFTDEEIAVDFEYRSTMNFDEDICGFNISDTLLDEIIDTAVIKLEKSINDYSNGIYKKRIIILIDHIETSRCVDEFFKRVAYYINLYNYSLDPDEPTNMNKPDICVFVVTDDEKDIPQKLRNELPVLYINKPCENERLNILSSTVLPENLRTIVAHESEGLSCADIKDIGKNLGWLDILTESEATMFVKRLVESKTKKLGNTVITVPLGISPIVSQNNVTDSVPKNKQNENTQITELKVEKEKNNDEIVAESNTIKLLDLCMEIFEERLDFSSLDE